MPQQPDGQPGAKSYFVGDVGAHARVAQGEHIIWTETVLGPADAEALQRQFSELLARIEATPELDEVERDIAREKTEAVAVGLATAARSPGGLRKALLDAKGWMLSSAGWLWEGLQKALTSQAGQRAIAGITEATTRAAIQSLLGPR
ncbi:MAG TPA: hypothetical protein VG452_11820 [Egibacteraceae bacterium]|nr:hypothetical protein [Actinomycetota bacterium]HWB72894.1 hypothetical protein [Egibacteraceae bacterium]